MTTTRGWLRLFTLAAAMAVALAPAAPALAGAPQQKSVAPAPGYYRIMVGAIEVTALSDGTDTLPAHELFPKLAPAEVDQRLARAFLTAQVETSFNVFLINTGSKLVMVDAGQGKVFAPELGRLVENMRAAGYAPEQVDEIYLTHMHTDHMGGLLLAGGKAAFPNALVRADQAESDYKLSKRSRDAAPAAQQGSFDRAAASLAPYIGAGKFKPFSGNTELVPGVHSLAAHGHTPGHSFYVVESGGQKLVLVGDVVHMGAVQFEDPMAVMQFDADAAAGAAQRSALFADAASHGYLVGAAHLPFPAFGHIRAEGKAYAWVPLNYQVPHGR